MSINPISVEFYQRHAKPYSIYRVLTTISKITKENFAKICWQLKTPTWTWKYTRCIMQMSYLYASDFPFKNFCKLAEHAETIPKICFGKSKDAYSLSIRVQTTVTIFRFLRFYVFYHNYNINVKENAFFQSASWKRHTLTRAAWLRPSNFWLARSEHSHASYPGLSLRSPGFSPYRGREERRVQGLD